MSDSDAYAEEMRGKIGQLINALNINGSGWHFEEDDVPYRWRAVIRQRREPGPERMWPRITCNWTHIKGRISFTALFPRADVPGGHYGYPKGKWEITCSATRSGSDWRSELERRLLPRYINAWHEQCEKVLDTEKWHADKERDREWLAARLQGKVANHSDNAVWIDSGMDLEVPAPGRCRLGVGDLSPAEVVHLVTIVRAWRSQEEKEESCQTSSAQ